MGMSVQEYNNMLYKDFVLKMEGFKNRQEYEEDISRTIAYSAYIAPHTKPSDKPKTLEAFWPLKKRGVGSSKKVSDERRAAIKKALKQDQEQQKLKDG